jgi:TRAP transporter TAXI family solute receptor
MIRGTSIIKLTLIIYLPIFVVLSSSISVAEKTRVTLGGKGISGPFFPTAGTIANSVNQKRNDHGIRITVKSRRGSVSIIKSVLSGEFEFGVVHGSRIFQAYNGLAEWKGRPQKGLRSICNVHAEQIVLVASVESGIRNLCDLNGRRVFIGGPRSDLRDTAIDILTAAGIDPQSDLTVTGAAAEVVPGMMQDDAIDAFFYTMGTTNRALLELFAGPRPVALVPILGAGIDKLTAANPFYEKSVVSIKFYPYYKNETDVVTISVKAGLMTSAEVPDRIVYTIAEEVFENVDVYKNRHPTARVLTWHEMTEGLASPVHPGAAKFYQQSGIEYSVGKP